MDASAIQSIIDMGVTAHANSHHVDMPPGVMVIPNTSKTESLEKFKPYPDFFRAHFKTNVLAEFIGYLNFVATEESAIFINKDNAKADAIIDMGTEDTPRWGKHRAHVDLKNSPAYDAVLSLNNRMLVQQDLIDFCEDWQPNIKFFYGQPSDTSAELFATTLSTLRKLKVLANGEKEQVINNFSASASALESIEIKAGNAELPSGFLFEVIPHDGFDSIVLICQLRAASDDKAVKLKYRINQLEAAQDVIANEFRDKIKNGINLDDVSIYIGDMAYQ